MTLLDQIHREDHAIKHLEAAIKEARRDLWEANFVRRNDERRKGESEQHWHRRRRRNRTAYEHRDDAVEHLVKKRKAHEAVRRDLREKRQEIKEDHRAASGPGKKGSSSIVTFDGVQVVSDAAYWLAEARKHGWHGTLVSGYRSPAYSTSLCYGMCGAPSCPGRCAGASSNHARTAYPGPAVDVTDFITCERVLIDIGSGYYNDLPYDLVHMSKSGH